MEIQQHDSPHTFRFALSGDLTRNYARELEGAWRTAQSILAGKELVVDVSEVASVDPEGLDLLSRMRMAGAHLIASRHMALPELLELTELVPAGRR